jgi:Protein of unknown function (DUF1329)
MLREISLAIVTACMTVTTLAAVSAEEARQLGTTLTPIGAEKAGNKDGTIPEYAGGLAAPPPTYQTGAMKRPSPFAGEKPRLVINRANFAQHADTLTEGTKELLKRYPTMRVDVYPTHRLVNYPARIVANTKANATGARLIDSGLGTENVMPGFPFPIPKDGYEAMWNHLLAYKSLGWFSQGQSWNVDASGRSTLVSFAEGTFGLAMYDPKRPGAMSETDPFAYIRLHFIGPARRNGEAILVWDSANPLRQGRRTWLYLPGQRRVKLAPDVSYDTPNPGTAGTANYDDMQMFNGAMDRFDFKLIGKRELIVPYSNYTYLYEASPADVAKPNHVNPDVMRWELHRVWVVEATLRPDQRHVYSKRVFYIDEDSWIVLSSDEYDGRGRLYRSAFSQMTFSYDVQAPFTEPIVFYDFSSGAYTAGGLLSSVSYLTELPPESFWSPDALAGAGLR